MHPDSPLHEAAVGGAAGSLGWLGPALFATALIGLYAAGVHVRARRRRRPWSAWRTLGWCTGSVLLAVGLAPSLHDAAVTDMRAHMAQHLLLGMYAPIALVLAAPVTLALGALPPAAGRALTRGLRHRVVHVVSHPVTAAVLSTGGLFVLYLTPLHHLSQQHGAVGRLVAAHLVASGVVFAWAIAGPDPAPRRPGVVVRAGVLVVSAAGHAVLATSLYARAGEVGATTHDRMVMETAAQWMYYGGDLAEVVLAVALFAGWYTRAGRRTPDLRSGATGRTELPAAPLRRDPPVQSPRA